jgi:tRNA (cytidine32/uridine32-2'-O)-methyltransferase
MFAAIRIVLVETSHPGNIGAVARAMKNMCLSELVLVAPQRYPSAEATARASGADDILERACVVGTLDEAVADCRLVVGSSARRRTVEWPELDPRQCAGEVMRALPEGPVALVFGRENSGLTNEELGRCRFLVHIPANREYSSLNLAMAVQVIAYELLMASRAEEGKLAGVTPGATGGEAVRATAGQMQGLFDHLAQALEDFGFADERRSDKLMRRLRRLFHRAEPDADDINILRGILSAGQGRKSMRRDP